MAPSTTISSVDFDAIYRRYHRRLARYAAGQGAVDPDGMADLALLDGYRALGRLRSNEPAVLEAYLFRATRSHVIRESRQRRDLPVATIDDDAAPAAFEHSVAATIDMGALLDELPPDQRHVIELRFLEDLSTIETADRLGKTPGAVRQLQLRALRRLRRVGFIVAVVAIVALAAAAAAIFRQNPAAIDVDIGPADGGAPTELDEQDAPNSEDGAAPELDASAPTGEPRLPPAPAGAVAGELTAPGDPAPDTDTDTNANANADPNIDAATRTDTGSTIDAGQDPGSTPSTPVGPVLRPDMLAYDGFDAIGAPFTGVGSSSFGFEPGATWTIIEGTAVLEHDPNGLTYTDAAGLSLATMPGALRISDISGRPQLARLAAAGSTFHSAYYVAFLLRSDGPETGDFFWSTDGITHLGGGGLAADPRFRMIGDSLSEVTAEPGATTLVVIHVRPPEFRSQIYLNPNLASPLPQATATELPAPMATSLIFAMTDRNNGAYTLDEVRFGRTFRSVTPLG
ncbi:MAG: sigma-70 family RNA polymerase sigma factor [Actinomycetota bacterium]